MCLGRRRESFNLTNDNLQFRFSPIFMGKIQQTINFLFFFSVNPINISFGIDFEFGNFCSFFPFLVDIILDSFHLTPPLVSKITQYEFQTEIAIIYQFEISSIFDLEG